MPHHARDSLPLGFIGVSMSQAIELSDELVERIDELRRNQETREEFIEEIINIYEHEGRFTDEGL